MKEFTDKLLSLVDSRVTVDKYIEAGDRVVAVGRTRGTVCRSGTPFDIRVVHVWTVKGGKATRFEPHIDAPGMLKALAGPT